jgi:hypothetical protein
MGNNTTCSECGQEYYSSDGHECRGSTDSRISDLEMRLEALEESVDAIEANEHKVRHQLLHESLDELVADFIRHNDDKRPSSTTVLELMEWSHAQTVKPEEP